MNKPNFGLQTNYGFISIRQIEEVGYCGGLLVVSERGRPLEFHCSAPIIPNPTQQILFGKTYLSYLFCEQIGLALLEKSKLDLSVIIGNSRALWELANSTDSPLVILDLNPASNASSPVEQPAHKISINSFELLWNQNELSSMEMEQQQRQQVRLELALQMLGSNIDLDEPFERIDKAITAAQIPHPS